MVRLIVTVNFDAKEIFIKSQILVFSKLCPTEISY